MTPSPDDTPFSIARRAIAFLRDRVTLPTLSPDDARRARRYEEILGRAESFETLAAIATMLEQEAENPDPSLAYRRVLVDVAAFVRNALA